MSQEKITLSDLQLFKLISNGYTGNIVVIGTTAVYGVQRLPFRFRTAALQSITAAHFLFDHNLSGFDLDC